MKKSKIILRYSFLLFFVGALLFVRVQKLHSHYDIKETEVEGILWSYQIDGNQLKAEIKAKELILIQYYFQTEQEKIDFEQQYHLGDTLKLIGTFKRPTSNRNFHLFDYQNYLKSKKIFWILNASQINHIKHTKNPLFIWKGELYRQINKRENAAYFKYLLLGDSSEIDTNFKDNAQFLGISHLFAISGMHVHLLVGMLLWIIQKIMHKKSVQGVILFCFLIFYCFLTNFSPSVVRASSFFLLLWLKKQKKWRISSLFLLGTIFIGMLFYNPYYIYHLGFLLSFLVSFALLYYSRFQKKQSYFKQLFQTSWISFWIGLPILIRNFFRVNFLTPIWNLFFVPFVSLLLFPACCICLLCPFLNTILDCLFWILNRCMEIGNQITLFEFSFAYISLPILFCYYMIIGYALSFFFKRNYKSFFLLFIILFLHYHIGIWRMYSTLTMLDVGQGDSILIQFPHNQGNILIDTGGTISYSKEKWKQKKKEYSIGESITIPYLRSVGIHGLDYLILTHGDIDHIGEAINLIDNFKVQNVIFNNDDYNGLETELIQVLEKKKINYYKGLKELKIGDNKLSFLNTKEYGNENDNSNVICLNINHYKFLFMGDAGVNKEKDIIEKYKLTDIDFLKVGHHGSNTSSGQYFISNIAPKNCLISVGKNNRYGHPKESVMDILDDYCDIYRTDLKGSIQILINQNSYKIRTYSP